MVQRIPGLLRRGDELFEIVPPDKLEDVGTGGRDQVRDLDAVPEDAVGPLRVLFQHVVVDLVQQRDDRVHGVGTLYGRGVQLVQAELAVSGGRKIEKKQTLLKVFKMKFGEELCAFRYPSYLVVSCGW